MYDRCALPRFKHDFDNVSYEDGRAFDDRMGIPGLHSVSGKVQYSDRHTILPPDLFERFTNRCFWRKSHRGKGDMPMSAAGARTA